MNVKPIPIPRATGQLAPARRAASAARSRPLQISLAIALLLHLALGALFMVRLPAFLVHDTASTPREAEVEMIQNDMPTMGDQPIGGTGKTNQHVDPGQQAPPPPASAARAAPATLSPNLPVAPDSDLPPPQATPPAPQADPRAPPPPAETGDQPPAIRLTTSDDAEGLAGGTAETPATPDPKISNKLPAYPRDAAVNREQGEVDMLVRVTPEGTAAAVLVANSSGHASLDTAAVHAVQRWKFRPARDHGAPVSSEVPVRLNFVLK